MALISRKQAGEKCERLREAGERVVFTNGCFDLLHSGHVQLFRQAAEQGDYLIVGLNSDSSIRDLKGPPRPLLPETERGELLDALGFVDDVTIFSETTPRELIEAVKPDVLVKGEDYDKSEIVGADFVESRGGTVYRAHLKEGRGTTELINKILAAHDRKQAEINE